MQNSSIRRVYSVAKKEFADNLRNRWIIALTIIFVILTIATSYLAGGKVGSSSGFGGMESTVVVLLSISSLLIPLIAIMLGYATISGECESGSLGVLLSYPVKRIEIFLGKFLGLGSVLVVSIVIGFGAGGIIIAGVVGTASWAEYLAFISLTILLGLLYLSVSMFFSTLCAKRVASLGAGVILFFWSMIIGMIVFGIYLGTGGSYGDFISGNVNFPDWVWWFMLLSPVDMSQITILQTFGVKQVFGFSVEMPCFMNLTLLIYVQIIWIIEPLMLAIYFFQKRDI